MTKRVLPPHQSIYLYRSTWLIIGSVISAIRYTHYDLAILSFLSFLTSLVYWRNPIQKSWQQTLDRLTVRSSFVFLAFRVKDQWHALVVSDKQVYILLAALGISCYIGSRVLSKIPSMSCYSCPVHVVFHVLANISNMYIFSKI